MGKKKINKSGVGEKATQTEWMRRIRNNLMLRILIWATRWTEILVTKGKKMRKGCHLGEQ